jgi:hypothetical protein
MPPPPSSRSRDEIADGALDLIAEVGVWHLEVRIGESEDQLTANGDK